jgi:hypothetical protein
MRPDQLKAFKPALLQLKKTRRRVRENHREAFTYDESLLFQRPLQRSGVRRSQR